MRSNFMQRIKNLSLLEVNLLELYQQNLTLGDISTAENTTPKRTLQILYKSFRNLADFSVIYLAEAVNNKILKITDRDLKSFIDSAKILYRLKVIRKTIGITMAETSDYLDITRQTYAKIEDGEADLTESYIKKITDFINGCFVNFFADYKNSLDSLNFEYIHIGNNL